MTKKVDEPGEIIHKVLNKVAGRYVQRLMGFWVLWHAFHGMEGMISSGTFSRANVYKQRAEFLLAFKVDVDDFLPEYGSKFYRDEQSEKKL